MDDPVVELGGTEWTLVELVGEPVELGHDETVPHLVFDLEEAHVSGSTGCNRIAGAFALSEDELRFGALATTRMACAEEVMQRERRFLEALARVTSFELDCARLTLLQGDEAVAKPAAGARPEDTALR
jgi:heat shock protein HslJ